MSKNDKLILENLAVELDELQQAYDKLVIEHNTREVDLLQFLGAENFKQFCHFCSASLSERQQITKNKTE